MIMISVCMSTYDGEKYINKQLESIRTQTRIPDEVIICDDKSTDQTPDHIRQFIENNHLEERWHFYENDENLGYPGGFYHAMGLCKGDIVFLSDQDDIWDIHKIERMCQVFADHPEAKAVCCKFGLIDAMDHDVQTLMAPAKSRESGGLRRVDAGEVFYKCEWPGMVLAYKNKWLREVWKAEKSHIPHDFLICALAGEAEGFLQLDENLAWHRRHEHNVGGEEHRIGKLLSRDRKLQEIENYNRILQDFAEENVLQTDLGKCALLDKQEAMKARYEALLDGRARTVLKNAWKHKKQVRMKTLLADLLISLKSK